MVGAVAGLVAGLGFILANMIFATAQGLPAIAPFAAIATTFYFDDAPQMNLNYIVTGVIVHFVNSVVFGIVFAFVVLLVKNTKMLVVAAIAYGLALYVVNFLILGSLIFKFFSPVCRRRSEPDPRTDHSPCGLRSSAHPVLRAHRRADQ